MEQDKLARNAWIDLKEAAEMIGRPFVDADVTELDLAVVATWYVENYSGTNRFIANIRPFVKKGLTIPQLRGALNVLRQEQLKIVTDDADVKAANARPVINPDEPADPAKVYGVSRVTEHKCYRCKAYFLTKRDVLLHLNQVHDARYRIRDEQDPHDQGTGAPVVEEETKVIANTSSTMNLDLSHLPDGYYAFPHPTKMNNMWLFVMVKRTRRDKRRDRRYVYGKRITGNQHVPAGTMEFKEWSSDSKELFGEQFPAFTDANGQTHYPVYKGEYEQQLATISTNPEVFAQLFSAQIGRCSRCGRTLTDDDSRNLGVGPECIKHIDRFRVMART